MTPNSRMPVFSLSRTSQGVLMAGGIALTCLLNNPAQAADQYCASPTPNPTPSGATKCPVAAGFNSSTDTYFWSPATPPTTTINLNNTIFLNKVQKLTLRGSSNVTINATGNPLKTEVLIGSLGTNKFTGGNSAGIGPDTFVVGNPPTTVKCTTSGVNCKVSGIQGAEQDDITLGSTEPVIIYIDRCLQMTAPYPISQPGKGGLSIANAIKANSSSTEPNYPTITDVAGTCPVASIGIHDLQPVALRGRDALLTPWERWWSATAPWSRGLHWLQRAMIALIQGPYAQAGESTSTPQRQKGQAPLRVASYEGVTRVILNDPQANFLVKDRESGSTIVVDAATHSFNGKTLINGKNLEANRANSTVYKQYGNEPIALGRGIVFVYHEPLGILAAYPNDRYPYGSERNPGSVIAQLVRGDGSALPATAINYVVVGNLSRSEGNAPLPTTSTGSPIRNKP